MSERPDSESSKDRLIELLQSGHQQSISDELLANLGEAERREFYDAWQAVHLLNKAKPATAQQSIDTASVHDARTPTSAKNQGIEASPGIRNLGHYEVLQTLGQGGFGIVVKALDTKLGRTVALKVPKVDLMLQDQDATDRFAREARLVAMLSHPAIVPIYETGADGPLLFIASAYCNGGNLAHWFADRNKKIAPVFAAKIVARLAEAVQHAHSRGVIHRDLKPGNVLLDFDEKGVRSLLPERPGGCFAQKTPDPFFGADDHALVDALRITDFGLAKLVSDDQTTTRSGATIGTPAYMSPEQARGSVDEIGSASDIYGLGAILYELITGRPPIVGESNIATMRAIETKMPEPPRNLNPNVSPDLSAICIKCLEKEPRHRYANALELQADLNAYLEGKPVSARPVGPATRLARWSKRNPVVASAIAVAFAALTIGLAFSIAYGMSANRATNRANRATRLAENRSDEALSQAKLARKAVDDLQRAIAEEPLLKSRGMQSFRVKLLDSANQYYQLVSSQRPDDEEVLREYVEILKGLAYLNAELGERTLAISILQGTVELQETEFPSEGLAIAKTKLSLANNLGQVRRHDEAIAQATSAVDSLFVCTEADPDSVALHDELIKGLCQLSTSQSLKGNHVEAEANADKALFVVSAKNDGEPQDWIPNQLLGTVLKRKTHTALALQKHDDVDHFAPLAIDMLERVGENNPQSREDLLYPVATIHSLHGASYNVRKLFEKAIEQFELERVLLDKLIVLRPEVASYHAQSANQLLRFAKCLYESGDIQTARDTLTANLPKIRESLNRFPEENVLHVTIVLCYQLSAKTFRKAKDLASATTELAKGIVLCEKLCESDQAAAQIRMILSTLYMEQSTFFLQQKLYAEAAAECKQALDILEALYRQEPAGQHVGQLEFAYMLYGNAMNKLERYEELLIATEHVDDWPLESPSIRKALIHRIDAMAHIGRWEQARDTFESISAISTEKQSCLNMAGLASKCAALAADEEGANGDDHEYFIAQSIKYLESVRGLGMLEDESVVEMLNEHPDFSELRKTEAFTETVR